MFLSCLLTRVYVQDYPTTIPHCMDDQDIGLCGLSDTLQDQHVFDNMVILIQGSPFTYESKHYVNIAGSINISIPNAFKYDISFDARTYGGQGSISICRNIDFLSRQYFKFLNNRLPGTQNSPALNVISPSFVLKYDIKGHYTGYKTAYFHVMGWMCSAVPNGAAYIGSSLHNSSVFSYVSNPCKWTGVSYTGGTITATSLSLNEFEI